MTSTHEVRASHNAFLLQCCLVTMHLATSLMLFVFSSLLFQFHILRFHEKSLLEGFPHFPSVVWTTHPIGLCAQLKPVSLCNYALRLMLWLLVWMRSIRATRPLFFCRKIGWWNIPEGRQLKPECKHIRNAPGFESCRLGVNFIFPWNVESERVMDTLMTMSTYMILDLLQHDRTSELARSPAVWRRNGSPSPCVSCIFLIIHLRFVLLFRVSSTTPPAPALLKRAPKQQTYSLHLPESVEVICTNVLI
jgi:hypothetical protein